MRQGRRLLGLTVANDIRRVALVLTELRPGGMERVVTHLATTLPEMGVMPVVVCLENPGELAAGLDEAGVEVVALESFRGFDLKAMWRLKKLVRSFGVQVVNVHDSTSLPYAAGARLMGARVPIVFTGHGLLYEGFEKPKLRYRLPAKLVSAVTAVSEPVAERHVPHLGWTGPVDVISNGVPVIERSEDERARIRRELGIDESTTVFLSVGNARPEKGFEDLLDAAATLQQNDAGPYCWLVVGKMPETDYCTMLRQKHRQLDLEGVVNFVGFRGDVESFYSATDVLVMPSRSEGLPMVILEAMTAGLPIVATAVGGIPEALDDGAGRVVPPRRPTDLAGALARVMNDTSMRADLGETARRRSAEKDSVQAMTRGYLEVYRRVAGVAETDEGTTERP